MPGKTPSGLFSTGLTDNIFPDHRDRVTASILERMIDLMATDGGVVIDSLADTDLQVIDAGGGKINVKAGVGYDKFGQRIYIAADDAASALYVGTVDLSGNVDLSTNKNVKIDIDDAGAVQIDCQGATPAATTIDEVVAAINAAGFGTIAFRTDASGNPLTTGSYVMVKSTTVASSEVEFVAPSATDATTEIFGLSEAAYPHTYTGGGGYTIPDDSTDYDVIIEYLNVESSVGNFESGYPTGSDTEYTLRDDSYIVTVQLSSIGPVSDSTQHELLLAIVSNTGGTLTITDNRDQIMLRLKGQRDIDSTPPAAPVLVSLTVEAVPFTGIGEGPTTGYLVPRWEAVSDASGIREYIIKLILTEQDGTAVVDADPIEYTLQGFDQSASELQMKIELPLGNKYDVYVSAKDNSLSQNISPFTNLGNIQLGGSDTVTMPPLTMVSIPNGVLVDWPAVSHFVRRHYEYCWSEGSPAGVPNWEGVKRDITTNSEFTVIAAPGIEVRVRVRVRYWNGTLSNEVTGTAIAGGTIIGANEKVIPVDGLSVVKTDAGKAARFQKNVFLPNPATIVKLAIDVQTLTLNSSARGMIRIYRENSEAGAVNITFDTTGLHEVELSAAFTAGWIVVDAYDSAESGSDQAAFTALLAIVYAEGQVTV